MCKEIFEQKILVPWDQIFHFWALTPNAGPTQTHAGCRWTPYDFLDHADHVFLKDIFVVFQSILQRCVAPTPQGGVQKCPETLSSLKNEA